ncbi:MAG: hypothetical protein HOO95_06860 [Gallionella sp.]|nr:hypothetical protein [Gallionella sp.]
MTLKLPIEPTDDQANPAFKNAASCVLWVKQLQLTNLQVAQQQLLTQVNELNRYPMRNIERLNTLEALRETVDYVQSSYATKLIEKPLPFNQAELLVFIAIVKLWQAMASGYQRCLQSHLSGDLELDKHAALLCQRCMLYGGLAIFEHLRAGYKFDGLLWQQLHKLYEFSEQQGLALKEVPDLLLGNHPPSSCHRIYVKTLLACYARPSELSRTQLQILDNWLSEWAKEIAIESSYVNTDKPALAIDLSSTYGLCPIKRVTHNQDIRYLAVIPLSKLLQVNTILLEQGKTLQQLKLGDGTNSKDCIRFLTFLHKCWCEETNSRLNERASVSKEAQLCFQTENIYANVNGFPFKQPARDLVAQSLTLKQTTVFDSDMTNPKLAQTPTQKFRLESWHVENESITGAQLIRENLIGERICFNQLIAIRSDGDENFSLAATAWVNVLLNGKLRMGIRYLPGAVQGISIRTLVENTGSTTKFLPAFLLDTVQNLNIPASLIIPRNWFQPNREIEIILKNGTRQQAKLGFSVERGVDFERVSFKLL